ncbi:MAG: low specificity L-threonine aldolase [Rhodospirillales bacterium]|nr:low specificity L-threonine aldolase [Rhodospirillales bacterium]
MPQIIDLSSDAASELTPAMRQVMAEAEVGDEQSGRDPTVTKLCAMVAELLGKEDALFLPSGTMCNLVAFRVHCQPGDEIICDRMSHVVYSENGAIGALIGANARTIDGQRGIFTGEQVEREVRHSSESTAPRSRLLSVEQPNNRAGGSIWPLGALNEVAAVARRHGLATHMDGARLLNVVAATKISAKNYVRNFDSAWIDFSKGLACPIGGVLAGSTDFIKQAWRYKRQFGGAMRKAGIVAAAGVYALRHHVDRLAEDNANARHLAMGLAQISGLTVRPDEVDTNIVSVGVGELTITAHEFAKKLLSHGVRVYPPNHTLFRCATHLGITRADCDTALAAIAAAVTEVRSGDAGIAKAVVRRS